MTLKLNRKTNLRIACLLLSAIAFAFYFDPLIFLLSLAYCWFCFGVMNEIFMHSYVSHRAFEFKNKFIRDAFYYTSMILSPEANPVVWAAIHRGHHRHSDTIKDPHHAGSADYIGFFRAATGQFTFPDNWEKLTKDLTKDSVVLFCCKWGEVFFVAWLILLAMIDIKYMLWFGAMPIVTNQLMVAGFNTYLHKDLHPIDRPGLFWTILFWGANMHIDHHAKSTISVWPLHKFVVSLISKKKE